MKTNQIGPYVHSFEDINANRNDYTELIQISDGNNRIDKYKTSRAISSTRFYKRQIDQLTLEYIRNMNNKIVSKLWPKKKNTKEIKSHPLNNFSCYETSFKPTPKSFVDFSSDDTLVHHK